MSDVAVAVSTPAATSAATEAPAVNTSTSSAHVEGESAKTEAKESTEAKAAKRYLKTKVNGKEVQVDEETLLRDYGKYASADDKYREAARLAKSTEAFLKALQENPEAVLSDPRLPIKKKELAEKWLREAIESELESPEAKAAKERDAELEKYKKKEQEEKTKQEQAEYQKVVAQKREAIATTLSKAMEMSPLAKDPDTQAETLREMASYMRMCRAHGHEATPEEIAGHVLKQKIATITKLAGSLEVEDLEAALGQEFFTKMRKYDLARLQKARQKPTPSVSDNWTPTESKAEKREFIDPYSARIKK